MQIGNWSRIAVVASVVNLCVITGSMFAVEAADMIPVAGLPQAVKTAKAQFRPLTSADIEQARQETLVALERLDRRLAEAGDNGKAWRSYLRWEAIQRDLRDNAQPDRAALLKIYERFNAGHDGLELVWFLDVQRALHHYIAMMGAVNNAQIQPAYAAALDQLAKSLASYAEKPTTEDARSINESIRFLREAHQASDLIQAVQHHYAKPNFYARVSGSIVGAGIADSVDDVTPVTDCILGTAIEGTAHTVGKTTANVIPNAERAAIETLFSGVANSTTVGSHHPVTIYSTAVTDLNARKLLFLSVDGISSEPATSQANTQTCIQDIQANSGRQMVENIAWKRAGRQKAKAEAIASVHAEERLNDRVDAQAATQLDKANQEFTQKVRQPLEDRKLFSRDVRFSTTNQALAIVAMQASESKLAAQCPPPAAVEGADMTVAIHESAINNFTYDALAGRTIYEEKAQAAVVSLLGRLPERMKGDEDGKPWAITFDARQPIAVSFADNGFKVILRGARYYKGDDSYPAMNVTATYKIVSTAQGFEFVRQGDIEVLPPDFKAGEQIDTRRQVIRTLLAKRFAKVFEPKFLAEGFELPGRWKVAGRLVPIQVVCQDGWLVISWKKSEQSPKSEPAPQTAAR